MSFCHNWSVFSCTSVIQSHLKFNSDAIRRFHSRPDTFERELTKWWMHVQLNTLNQSIETVPEFVTWSLRTWRWPHWSGKSCCKYNELCRWSCKAPQTTAIPITRRTERRTHRYLEVWLHLSLHFLRSPLTFSILTSYESWSVCKNVIPKGIASCRPADRWVGSTINWTLSSTLIACPVTARPKDITQWCQIASREMVYDQALPDFPASLWRVSSVFLHRSIELFLPWEISLNSLHWNSIEQGVPKESPIDPFEPCRSLCWSFILHYLRHSGKRIQCWAQATVLSLFCSNCPVHCWSNFSFVLYLEIEMGGLSSRQCGVHE